MKRFKALLKITWWLWLTFFIALTILSWKVSVAFLVMFPVCIVIAIYFAYMRFDKDGNPIEES